MGYITNQWLKRDSQRHGEHTPVKVKLTCESRSELYAIPDERTGSYSIRGTRADGNYQSIYFTKSELNEILPSFAHGADLGTLQDLALTTLLRLDGRKLLTFLGLLLSKRAIKKSNAASKRRGKPVV